MQHNGAKTRNSSNLQLSLTVHKIRALFVFESIVSFALRRGNSTGTLLRFLFELGNQHLSNNQKNRK
jgi:hypothetical protein